MKNSPINKGYAAKPSPVKLAFLAPLIAGAKTLAAGIGAKVAAAGGAQVVAAKALGAAGKAAGWAVKKAGEAAVVGAVQKGLENINQPPTQGSDPNDPFGGTKMGV